MLFIFTVIIIIHIYYYPVVRRVKGEGGGGRTLGVVLGAHHRARGDAGVRQACLLQPRSPAPHDMVYRYTDTHYSYVYYRLVL